ncbi:hypothetical protein Hanom_Chr16g01501821 [Helianthus anomalus]
MDHFNENTLMEKATHIILLWLKYISIYPKLESLSLSLSFCGTRTVTAIFRKTCLEVE